MLIHIFSDLSSDSYVAEECSTALVRVRVSRPVRNNIPLLGFDILQFAFHACLCLTSRMDLLSSSKAERLRFTQEVHSLQHACTRHQLLLSMRAAATSAHLLFAEYTHVLPRRYILLLRGCCPKEHFCSTVAAKSR